ncbi:hypothetical protein LAZ67_18001152 [Cordylochernes scorpioides]|uniref:Integrase catalytic domain-containing protein n=1 Tax=Cordylochernes scorpioides TaxID=51811 RepID=A0ABY6LFK1_9ARAC|nr:hypothetical protein LAZ67_18001152 [Cordylochernes scorpioides]
MDNYVSSQATIMKLREIFARFRITNRIINDNGTQFTSKEFATFVKELAIKHTFSPPKHPATNGAVENFSIKDISLKDELSIEEALINFLNSYRITPHSTTNRSPSEMMFRRMIRSGLDILKPSQENEVRNKMEIQQNMLDHESRLNRSEIKYGQRISEKVEIGTRL